MSAYTPHGAVVIAGFVLIILLVTFVVRLIEIRSAHENTNQAFLAWTAAAITCASATLLTVDQPAGVRMVAIIMSTLIAIKAVALSRSRSALTLRSDRWLTFVWLWPAMQPKPFAGISSKSLAGAKKTILHGIFYGALGIVVVLTAQRSWSEFHLDYISVPLALIGISLCLHFGFLNILTGALRSIGIDVKPLFDAPLKSTSLREFWGERWNLAFNDMTARFVLVPVARLSSVNMGVLASFVFSGLLHEMAISLPAQAGFGLPLLYFVLHGVACVAEREMSKRKLEMNGALARLWTTAWIVIPLPLVFHSAFIDGVIWPIIKG